MLRSHSAAAAVTLEICALLNFPLNYANIIALPVLLGVGVAFKIYYVLAWRQGETNFGAADPAQPWGDPVAEG